MRGADTPKLLSSATREPENEAGGFEDTAPQSRNPVGTNLRGMAEMAHKRAISPLIGESIRSAGLSQAPYINQSDLSRHGALNEEFLDMKNRRMDFSNRKKADAINMTQKEKRFAKSNKSLPFSLNDEDEQDIIDCEESQTVQTILDVTGRLSNLVRLIDENSRLIQPSDLTVQSYESQSISATNNSKKGNVFVLPDDHADLEQFQRVSSLDKINSFLANKDHKNAQNYNSLPDSSLENTKTMLEDLLKDEDSKFVKQLDDLKYGSLARQIKRVK